METYPRARHDLEFFPARQDGQEFILVRDHLGLSPEGTALGIPLYQFLTLLDGSRSITDLQTIFMRQQGGVLVGSEEILGLLNNLDATYLLDSEAFQSAKGKIVADFTNKRIRPASHSGKSYPDTPAELRARLNEIMADKVALPADTSVPSGKIQALVAPHIDLNVGHKSYAQAYGMLKDATPTRVVVLGTGHQLQEGLFSLTDKDFETPLGIIKSDGEAVDRLKRAGQGMMALNDFIHRSEHSIEFQLIFLQHVMRKKDFSIIPILCGSLKNLAAYTRQAFVGRASPFLETLQQLLDEPGHETLLVAGVDFSHTGPKFGHEATARAMENQSREHDQNLLKHLSGMNADHFWKESERVRDQYHVCGFSALACLLEVLSECRGTVLDYEIWHEAPTQSAVSFASVVFTNTHPSNSSS
jgi:MEMO1 family protein